MNSETRRYKDHWIRCVAIPHKARNNWWDCAVYVFVSEPGDEVTEPPRDSCFRTMLRGLPSKSDAISTGMNHAQGIVDRTSRGRADMQAAA